MDISYFKNEFSLTLPIAVNGIIWNGRPDEFSNVNGGLDYSQEFGLTPYAKTGAYGYLDGKPRVHNGHDFAGPLKTSLVMPLEKGFITYKGYDQDGYGNFLFFETETKIVNGYTLKMEFVLAHAVEPPKIQVGKWYKRGDILAEMGSTGMSSGPHTHFGGRPLLTNSDGSTTWAAGDANSRGYVDLIDFFITKPIFNKQDLINQRMKLVKKNGDKDVYAIDPKGRANLILNWDTYQAGVAMGLWEDKIEKVNELPELGQIIVLPNNN